MFVVGLEVDDIGLLAIVIGLLVRNDYFAEIGIGLQSTGNGKNG